MTTFLVIVIIWTSGKVTTSAAPYPTQEACNAVKVETPAQATNALAMCVPRYGPE